jgi:hypothetical protein
LFVLWIFQVGYVQLYWMECLYSGRGADQRTSLELLMEMMDFALSGDVPLYGSVLDLCLLVFFSGEGPRSRRYGRTAALRLTVQPYDEDEDDDYFCPFPSNGATVE